MVDKSLFLVNIFFREEGSLKGAARTGAPMKQLACVFMVFVMIFGWGLGLGAASAPADSSAKPKSSFEYGDRIGVVKIRPGEPIHIACWFAVAGSEATLGIDSKRGVEIAIEDNGGKLLGFPIKLTVEDTGCNPEGGQAAATKIAADPTVVAAIGSTCSSEARPGAPILWKAGIVTVSPSNTAPELTSPKRGPEYAGYLRTAHNDKVQGAVAPSLPVRS